MNLKVFKPKRPLHAAYRFTLMQLLSLFIACVLVVSLTYCEATFGRRGLCRIQLGKCQHQKEKTTTQNTVLQQQLQQRNSQSRIWQRSSEQCMADRARQSQELTQVRGQLLTLRNELQNTRQTIEVLRKGADASAAREKRLQDEHEKDMRTIKNLEQDVSLRESRLYEEKKRLEKEIFELKMENTRINTVLLIHKVQEPSTDVPQLLAFATALLHLLREAMPNPSADVIETIIKQGTEQHNATLATMEAIVALIVEENPSLGEQLMRALQQRWPGVFGWTSIFTR